jgi:ABC-type branched-subunit amino acid transport system ATPase component/predicted MFS family arabinose efflux permease
VSLRARWSEFLTDAGAAGALPLLVLIGLAGVQNFDNVAFGVLSPDIRHAFHLSNGSIDAIAALTGAVPIVFAVFLGYLGDRGNRIRLSYGAALLWGVTAIVTGLAPVVAVLIIARLVGGVGLLSTETIYPSLLSDYYPPKVLGSVFGAFRLGSVGLALLASPIAGAIGAVFGWRVAFVALAAPTFVLAVITRARLSEPARGAAQGLAGATEPGAAADEHGTIGEGFRRVRAIRTLRRTWVAAFLFGAGTVPFATLLNNFFKDVYHEGDAARGVVSLLYGVGGLGGILLGAWLSQREVQAGRPRRLAIINGLMIVEFAAGILLMAGIPVFAVSVVAATLLSVGAFGFLPAYTTTVSLVAPPKLRAQAYAWSLLWYALGAIVLQVVVIGPVINADGQRVAFLVLAALVGAGGAIAASSNVFVDRDIEQANRAESASQSDALLSCQGVDAAYSGVQVLFGVDFEIHAGEMVALLGTNGAGKSTFLKAITGLLDPVGGAVFFKGRDITHTDPMATARLGIMQVPGGRGIFPTLSVADNLKVAGWMFRTDKAYVEKATAQVLEYFPVLQARWTTMAGDLSGGEQQMLSLAQAFVAEPDLLLIDELSLGLAPTVVSRLVEILRRIHERGTTVILVEQSVNVALALAERAVFMEKGEVRFSGPTADLLDRPDILRAVFLKGAAAGQELAADATNGHAAGGRRAGATAVARRRREVKRSLHAPTVLETRSVSKRYGGVTAVDDVSFSLHAGEILGFIGPNGAGKTTLFDCISGFAPLDGGRILLHGDDVTEWPAHRRAGAGLGRSFQDARLWPALTVAECLAVALHREGETEATLPALLGLPRVADSETLVHDRVDELVDTLGLGAFRNKFVSELSTGSRRIVELGCMLALRPTVLILDEPSSGIAQRETEALGPLIRRIREQLACSILIIEHDIPLITALADRMIALDLGRMVAEGAPADVLSAPRVVESYLGEASDTLALFGRPRPAAKRGNGARTRRSSGTTKARR